MEEGESAQKHEEPSAAHPRLYGQSFCSMSLIYEMGFALPSRPPRTKLPIHRKNLHFAGFTARCRGTITVAGITVPRHPVICIMCLRTALQGRSCRG